MEKKQRRKRKINDSEDSVTPILHSIDISDDDTTEDITRNSSIEEYKYNDDSDV